MKMAKTAVITGATSGLGLEFVKLLAQDGYSLVLVGRSEEKLKAVRENGYAVDIQTIAQDLSLPGAARRVADELERMGIVPDILINNAGFGLMGVFDELSLEEQRQMIQVNIGALTELTYLLLPGMKGHRNGRILNVASIAAYLPGPYMAVYYASKAYVLSFSEALDEELLGTGVRVTAVCPGPTRTNFESTAQATGTRMFDRAMEADEVARIGYVGMKRGKRVVITGGMNRFGIFATRFVSRGFLAKLPKLLARK
ncbi:SDR family oxidoreductase [Gorillibacterium sp. CAU 1737]|uniref:SDR family NAD(P)-dependent oxidoreductase n=1 Tax=Gorillibacterium sp. CAU 1737 TaxID=3140362 RepID=UPI0032606065